MIRPTRRSTLHATLCPYTPLCRAVPLVERGDDRAGRDWIAFLVQHPFDAPGDPETQFDLPDVDIAVKRERRVVVPAEAQPVDEPEAPYGNTDGNQDQKGDGETLSHASPCPARASARSEEHTSELQSLIRNSY